MSTAVALLLDGRTMRQPVRLMPVLWPLLAELVLGFALGLAGLWLASGEGDAAAAGFSLAHQIVGATALLYRIVNMGVSVVITQSLGAGHPDYARSVARSALGASTRVGLVLAGSLWASSSVLLLGLGASSDVQSASTGLLQWLAVALVVDGYCAALGGVLRANLRGRAAMWVSLAMHAAHLVGCWVLMPRMGLVGFGVALLISRVLAMGLQSVLWRRLLGLTPSAADWWAWRFELLRPALRIGLPGAAEGVAYRLAMLVSVAVVTSLGTTTLAAHAYAQQLMTAAVLATVAVGFACEIVVGHLVGAAQLREANRMVKHALWLCMGLSVSVACVNAMVAPWSLSHFSVDPTVLASGASLMWLAVLLEPGRTCNVVVINALRGAGDAQFPVIVGAVSMVCVMAGGSWLLGVVLGWGLKGVWLSFVADETLRGVIMAWRWHSLGWTRHARLARSQTRVRAG